GNAAPLPVLDNVGIGAVHDLTNAGERVAAPVAELLDALVDQLRGLLRPGLARGGFLGGRHPFFLPCAPRARPSAATHGVGSSSTVPRHAPVSRPRSSMKSLNRSRSPWVRARTMPSASPVFSTNPWGSKSSWSSTRVWPAPSGRNVTMPSFCVPDVARQATRL